MGFKESVVRPIRSFLTERVYNLPDYQREYSWTADENLEDMWLDLTNCMEEDREHFFGQIVLHEATESGKLKYYIIDGQQRVSTSVIFLSVFRDLFERLDDTFEDEDASYEADRIKSQYIGRLTPTRDELRLRLGVIDREYFRDSIQKSHPNSVTPEIPSHKRIREAYIFFERKLYDEIKEISEGSEKVKKLLKYYNKFLDSFKVLSLVTDDINEAYVIFETLNARGKELETIDLLKNHLFRISNHRIEAVKLKWTQMVENLDNLDGTKYIRYYWNSRKPFVREKYLYRYIRDQITSAPKSEEFINDLAKTAEIYSAIIKPADNKFFAKASLNESIYNLFGMGATLYCPIILAMYSKEFNENDIEKVVKAIEVMIIRNFIVANLTANKAEVSFAKIAFNISDNNPANDKKLETVGKILEAIKLETINDEQFELALITFEIKNTNTAKLLLREICKYINHETVVNPNNTVINLEHIMPKAKGDWNHVTDEDHRKYLHRFGNLTLLLGSYNKSLKNKTFDIKKTTYNNSTVEITKQLTDYDDWSPSEIMQRQKRLADYMLQIWKV